MPDIRSSKTFLGSLNVLFITSGECKIERSNTSIVLMANRNIETVIGTARLPNTLGGVTHVMKIRILNGLNDSHVLGTDFVLKLGLIIDGKVRQM